MLSWNHWFGYYLCSKIWQIVLTSKGGILVSILRTIFLKIPLNESLVNIFAAFEAEILNFVEATTIFLRPST